MSTAFKIGALIATVVFLILFFMGKYSSQQQTKQAEEQDILFIDSVQGIGGVVNITTGNNIIEGIFRK